MILSDTIKASIMARSSARANDEPRRRGDSVDCAFETIKHGIITGRFAPGQRLITRDLMEQIPYSRSTFREAFRRLAAEGLVSVVPNRGACVQRLTRQEMEDLFRIRELLEGLAARLAAELIDDGTNRRRFLDVWKHVKKGDATREAYIEENQLFHAVIVEISGNTRLPDVLGHLQIPILMFQWRRMMTSKDIEMSRTEHAAIAKAILEGRADQADAAMRRHLHRAKVRTFMALGTSLDTA